MTGSDNDHAIRFWHMPTGTEVLRRRHYTPELGFYFASDDSVLIEGIPTLTNAFQWTPLPTLVEIDAHIKRNALIRIDPSVP